MNCKIYRNWQKTYSDIVYGLRKERLSLMGTEKIKEFDNNLLVYSICNGKHHFKTDGINVDTFTGYCPVYTGNENMGIVQEIEQKQEMKKEGKKYTFENYEGNNREIGFIKDFYNNTIQKNMVLIGNNGTGKSHLCQALQTYLIRNNITCEYILYKELEQIFFSVQTWIEKETRAPAQKRLRELIKTNCLIIDDLGKDISTKSDIPGSELFGLLEEMQGKLVITTNLKIDKKENYDISDKKHLYLNKKFDNRIISRLLNDVAVINIKGSDYRTKEIK